jgi:dTDP-4-dehydrorhamnose 3,5-epimerase
MKVTATSIEDVKILEPAVFGDERGFFMETWHKQKFAELGIDDEFVQDNHSKSNQGILRGMHYQLKNTQGKLVRVIAGEVFDVTVDVRKQSSTFGQWVGVFLSSENKKMLWVPPGFAHGFYVTSDTAEFVYKCTDYYAPEHERCIAWDDPDLAIDWPLVDGQPPQLSAKDSSGDSLRYAEIFD